MPARRALVSLRTGSAGGGNMTFRMLVAPFFANVFIVFAASLYCFGTTVGRATDSCRAVVCSSNRAFVYPGTSLPVRHCTDGRTILVRASSLSLFGMTLN